MFNNEEVSTLFDHAYIEKKKLTRKNAACRGVIPQRRRI